MNRSFQFALSTVTIALFLEACSIKKAEVNSDSQAVNTSQGLHPNEEIELLEQSDTDKLKENLRQASGNTNQPATVLLRDRLYPKAAYKSEPQVSSPSGGDGKKSKDEQTAGAVGYANADQAKHFYSEAESQAIQSAPASKSSAQYSAPAAPSISSLARTSQSRLAGRRGLVEKRMHESDGASHVDRRCFPDNSYAEPPRQNSEEYASIYENSFMDSRTNPLSTFSIDVDGASYSNTRRFLQEGQLPPVDAIRIEEFINYFTYDYPQPTGSDPFSITTEIATTPWNPETKLVHIGLQGRRTNVEKLPPSNLVFLIDVSGSMSSEDKLPLLKNGFDMLIDQMRPQDKISIVVYAGAAGMVLPPTSGNDKETIREALSRLNAGGSTAGGAGLMLAYQAAKQSFIQGGSNRVILATDGDFNVGLSSDEELVRLIEEKRKSGVFLSVLGFGTGNIKDSKMEQLADKGNGNYFYIDNINEGRKVLVEKMAGTLYAIAKDVKLQIEFNPALVKSYRLVGYENRVLAAEDFNDDKKDAGELGSGTNVTALYEIVPVHAARPAIDPLKYQNGGSNRRWNWGFGENEGKGELLTVKFRYKQPNGTTSKLLSRTLANKDVAWQDASQNFRFSAAVAGFGLVLRGSQYRGNLDLDKVASMGRGAKGRDLEGHRAEFLTLVETAKALRGYSRVNPELEME